MIKQSEQSNANRAMIKADRSPVVVGPAPLLPPAFLAASASRLRRNVSFLIASSVYSVRARLMGALGVDTAPADGVGACVNGEVVRSCSRIRLVSVVMASSFMRYLPLKVCDIHTGGPIHHKPVLLCSFERGTTSLSRTKIQNIIPKRIHTRTYLKLSQYVL